MSIYKREPQEDVSWRGKIATAAVTLLYPCQGKGAHGVTQKRLGSHVRSAFLGTCLKVAR